MDKVQIRVPTDTRRKLKVLAATWGQTMGEAVKFMVESYLNGGTQ